MGVALRGFTAVPGKGAACGSVMSGRKAMLETVKRDFTAVTVRNATLGSVKRGFTGAMGRNTTDGSVKRGFTEVGAGMLHLGVLRGFLLQ